MEKIRLSLILFFTAFVVNVSGQSWITGMTFDYSLNKQNWDSTAHHNIVLSFPSLSYDETFEIKLNDISSTSIYGGFKNHFTLKRNVLVADLSLGLNLYNYTFDLWKKSGSNNLDTSMYEPNKNDSLVWQEYMNDYEGVNIKGVYPAIRLHLGYKRELLNYRNIALYADAGMLIQRRFSFFQSFNKEIYNSGGDTIVAHFGKALYHKRILPSVYLGLSVRFGSNSFGLRLGSNIGSLTPKAVALKVSESFAQLTYSRLFRETHIGREQVIYDEYQHLSQTRASEYRQGDKFSYLQFSSMHKERAIYPSDDPTTVYFLEGTDSIKVTKEGYYVQPSIGFEIMLNTFFTHRWMMGLGLSMYEESYTSYGNIMTQGGQTTPFGEEILRSEPDNSYQEYWTKTKGSVGINTAVYVSKRTLPVDPYIKGSANMVMNYDVPEFLKTNSDWRSTAFFSVYKVGIGADLRLRLKSSKFFVLGIGADYNINPHINYMQYFVKVGYYRKKKLKNQRY